MLPISFKAFLKKLLVVKLPFFSPYWLRKCPRSFYLLGYKSIKSRQGLYYNLIGFIDYLFGFACTEIYFIHLHGHLLIVYLIGMCLCNRKIFSLSIFIKQRLMSVAKEIPVSFGRYHRHIPYMHLILWNETRLIALKVEMNVNQELFVRLARKSQAKLLLMPSLTNPANILQGLTFHRMALTNDSQIETVHTVLLNRIQ